MANLLKRRGGQGDPFVVSELIADNEQLESENEALTIKVARLQKENQYLRRVNNVRPHLKLVVRAQAAAQLLALWHCAGYRTGRPSAFAMGMSNDTWYAGRALLQVARVWDRQGWTTDDPATIEARLKTAVERCKDRPDLLGYHLPKSKRPKTFNPE
jgi:hypothetical protein